MINCLLFYFFEKEADYTSYYIGSMPYGQRYLAHHGIKGQKWGVKLGPPYPLTEQANSVNQLVKQLKGFSYKEFSTLMNPSKVKSSKTGSCHDQVYFEATELRKAGLKPQIKFLIEVDDKGQGGATHSFVHFKLGKSVFWLENAWGGMEGLHRYSSESSMMKDVKTRWEKNPSYPNLYSGSIKYDSLKPGMTLSQILDAVDLD